ncbi:MAG: PAS domain-containing sensor histidine kinase [Clostridia bacterium]|nr:PAS domain-containing sensor histidine kinase [Clostridia bacterium]
MIKRKLNLYFLVVIIITVLTAGIITSNISTNQYKKQVEDELRAMIGLTSLYIETTENYSEAAKTISKMLSSYTSNNNNIRVTIISSDGTVLGDSESDYLLMVNHLYRSEIRGALDNKIGVSTRKSATTGINYMYLALFTDNLFIRLSYPLINLVSVQQQIFLNTIIGGVFAVILALILSFRFSSAISYPISLLSEHSKQIELGNYQHKINYDGKNKELKNLIETFNEMTNELSLSFNNINSKNLQLDIILNSVNDGIIAIDYNKNILFVNKKLTSFPCFATTVVGANYQTIKSTKIISLIENVIINEKSLYEDLDINDIIFKCYVTTIPFTEGIGVIITLQDITEITKALAIRNDFVSNVTHELNTPLTSIQGFIETLKSGAVSSPDVMMNFLNIIDIEAERLKILINDILTLSSIENSSNSSNIETVHLRVIADEIILLLGNQINEKNITVKNGIDINAVLQMNTDHAKQLLINLIDNAVKYNITGGEIDLFTILAAGHIELHVKDTGIGIEEKHLSRLFERFYRVDKGRSRDMGGTGLGLSIVKHIAMLYKGHVSVKSNIGEGSDFIITFMKPDI